MLVEVFQNWDLVSPELHESRSKEYQTTMMNEAFLRKPLKTKIKKLKNEMREIKNYENFFNKFNWYFKNGKKRKN